MIFLWLYRLSAYINCLVLKLQRHVTQKVLRNEWKESQFIFRGKVIIAFWQKLHKSSPMVIKLCIVSYEARHQR